MPVCDLRLGIPLGNMSEVLGVIGMIADIGGTNSRLGSERAIVNS